MERRSFLLQVLLGWVFAIAGKIGLSKTTERSQNMSFIIQNPDPLVFYVAPHGNDSWSGKLQNVNATQDDGPFATLERAKIAIRELKQQQQGKLNSLVKVVLRGGIYFLSQTLVFEAQDSGTEQFPITYQSHPGEQAIISGGKVITGWHKEQVNNREMWTVTLPAEWKKQPFQHLWVNGERRTRPRYPNAKNLQVKGITQAEGQPWHKGQYSFQYHQGDLPQGIDLVGGEVVVMNRWTESRLPITRIDEAKQIIHSNKETVYSLQPGDIYYIENVLGILDTPGNWYLDRDRAKLYYLPKPGETITTIEVIAPILSRLILLKGQTGKNNPVEYLNFYNLSFQHTNWELPEQHSGYGQNASGVPASVTVRYGHHCTWQNCHWTHLGNYALELQEGCQYNRIINCEMLDLGAGGIKVGVRPKDDKSLVPTEQETHHTEIIGNHIFDGGKFFPSAAGIVTSYSHHNRIAQNQIHDFYYTAISVQGTWGFKKTSAYENLVEDNYIHHIGKLANGEGPLLSDLGGVYILGLQPGTVIRSNTIHDLYAIRYGGRGIYLDEGSSHILIENNLVYRTSHACLALHYGKENTIRNNIFALGGTSQIYRALRDYNMAKQQKYISLRLENNIFFWQQGLFMDGVKEDPSSHVEFERNIYWKINEGEINIANLSWQQWQEQGEDRNSIIANPLFVAPQRGDFRLQSDSPAIKLGFNSNLIPLHGKLPS
jgi:parallel beta-helix repeat protein